MIQLKSELSLKVDRNKFWKGFI